MQTKWSILRKCTITWSSVITWCKGADVLLIPFNWSVLQLSCKFKLHLIYRWISNAFECMNVHLKLLSMKWCCKGEVKSLVCGWNHLKEVCCKVICKINSNLNLNLSHMHVCYCSPILKWSNIETSCIFRFLEFFWYF